MSYDRVTVNMEREEVSLERTAPPLDPHLISTTTGGVEASCRDCLLPFGLVVGIIGLAATSVAGAHDSPGSVLSILGWVLLGAGILGVASSCLWQQYRRRKRYGSWTVLMEPEAKKAVV
ncbi:transmembrane protein 100-like [Rhineura floridana]|uniref:transmembrane protein 100-like n=1 Tax=Rhineura floridana TaxID=261503 RepID=UPI002AC8517D|nr:transmembrane protein 100-like [Rhineura floridana]